MKTLLSGKAAMLAAILAFAVFLSQDAVAVGMSSGTFNWPSGDAQQGGTYTADVLLMNSPNRDNRFIVTVGGDMGAWVTGISPNNFNLSAGGTRIITLTIQVPSDAALGMRTGTVTATGTQIIGGGTVGFQEAARGTLYANVIRSTSAQATTSGGSATASDTSGASSTTAQTTTSTVSGGASSTTTQISTTTNTATSSNTTYCAADVKQCPDGSYASRNPNANCEFNPCPVPVPISANITTNATANVTINGSVPIVSANISGTGGTTVSAPVLSSPSAVVSANLTQTSSAAISGGNIISTSQPTTQASVVYTVTVINSTPSSATLTSSSQTSPISANIAISRRVGGNGGTLITPMASVEYAGNLEIAESRIMMNTSVGQKPVNILPGVAIEASGILGKEAIQKVELIEKMQKPVYLIRSARQAKLLFFMPVSIEVQTDVDAETGNVISVSKPWWSFLAS